MSTDPSAAAKSTGEAHLLDRVIDRLVSDWPEFERSEVEQTVDAHYANFSRSSVRDFVPVLVERASAEDLASRSPAHVPGGHGPLWTRTGPSIS